MEPQYQTVAQMYARLQSMIRQHNDTGFRRAVAEAVLQPRNPFEPKKKRYPKQAVSIGISVVVVLTLIFLYFSFHPGRLTQ
jgi:type VI protein secretion system component VasF